MNGLPPQLQHALTVLNVWSIFTLITRARNLNQASEFLDKVKDKAKQNYIEQAKQHHPDVGGDPEQMKQLNAAMDIVKKIEIQVPRPTVIFYQTYYTGGSCYNSATNCGWSPTSGF